MCATAHCNTTQLLVLHQEGLEWGCGRHSGGGFLKTPGHEEEPRCMVMAQLHDNVIVIELVTVK
jgi:hypothetical protein